MKDSLVLMENKEELAKIELQYEFDKREQAKRIEQQRKDLFILFVIISLLTALIIIFFNLITIARKSKKCTAQTAKTRTRTRIQE